MDGWEPQSLGHGLVLSVAEGEPALVAHLTGSEQRTGSSIELRGSLADQPRAGDVTIVRWRDNELVARVQPSVRDTILFVSSQFHEDWVADGDGRPLETVPINDFYLGVELPPGVSKVALRFLPLSRWAWVPLIFFALAFLALSVRPGLTTISGWRERSLRGRGDR